jgi:hypothetical protein
MPPQFPAKNAGHKADWLTRYPANASSRTFAASISVTG